ncbi:hypothetical protein PF007_g30605, partial [Phytophthora fragariae]
MGWQGSYLPRTQPSGDHGAWRIILDPASPILPATQGLRERNGEMAMQGLKPAGIRMGMIRWFGLTEEVMPTLRQVQWLVRNFNKKELHRTDDYEDVLDQIGQLAYGPAVADTQPFSFGW